MRLLHCLPVCQSVCQSASLSVCQSASLPVCLSVCLSFLPDCDQCPVLDPHHFYMCGEDFVSLLPKLLDSVMNPIACLLSHPLSLPCLAPSTKSMEKRPWRTFKLMVTCACEWEGGVRGVGGRCEGCGREVGGVWGEVGGVWEGGGRSVGLRKVGEEG